MIWDGKRKDDRYALREVARSRGDGTRPDFEQTPAGLRETAADGTPRRAKAAGAQLRQLTLSFYHELYTFYGVTSEELEALCVNAKLWDKLGNQWVMGTRPLKLFRGKPCAELRTREYCSDVQPYCTADVRY